jgi:DeoR/GlpR family transcriptional regulator of sugar metabolism
LEFDVIYKNKTSKKRLKSLEGVGSVFAQERLEKILYILNKEGKVVVKELSKRFEVTEDCIRKDLKQLESDGKLKRIYGGAVQKRQKAPLKDVLNRKHLDIDLKSKIARKAYGLLKANETIFLDISTTNILIAEEIASGDVPLTVITNMIDIMTALNKSEHVNLIATGGVLNRSLDGFVGATTIASVVQYKPDKAFIGSCGVDLEDQSVTTFDAEDAQTKRAIIKSAKKIVLVMSSEKFYYDGTCKFAELDQIDILVLDEIKDNNTKIEIEKLGIEVL